MFDVAVIGGGICGCSLLYELSKYRVRAVLLEKETTLRSVPRGPTARSVHAGYDPPSGTMMARFNVEGAALIEKLCQKARRPVSAGGLARRRV